jgi:predicted RNA binding protein YcfA (HicA-like mRNA interferase family)
MWPSDRAENLRNLYLYAIRAFEKAGFSVVRQGKKHVIMSDGQRFLTIPRNNPINVLTMGGIVKDAGLSMTEFRKFLKSGSS